MKKVLVFTMCLIASFAWAQSTYPGGGGTGTAIDTTSLSLRIDAMLPLGLFNDSLSVYGLMKASAFADSARVHGAGLASGTRGNFAVWEGVDTIGSHFFPVMLFFEFDSSFLSHYGTTGFGGPQYNGPDSLMLDSLRAILPNAASGDTVGYRLVWGMIPFAWTDSIGTDYSIKAYNSGTTWNTYGWATNSKVIPPYWSYMVKIVEKDGTPPGRSTLAIRARYRW